MSKCNFNKQATISRAAQTEVTAEKIEKVATELSIVEEVDNEGLNHIFAHALSGILNEEPKDTMPAYLSKLAEDQADVDTTLLADGEEIPAIDLINLEMDDEPLQREGVSSDDTRRIEGIETEKPSEDVIKKETEVLLTEGYDIPTIGQELKKKFPEKTINKFLESHKEEFLAKYGQLGYTYLDKSLYNSCEDMKSHLRRLSSKRGLITKLLESENAKVKCRNCTKLKNAYCLLTNLKVANIIEVSDSKEATLIINKFASIDDSIKDRFIGRLAKENPHTVVSNFLSSIDELKRESSKIDSENKASFKRDIDSKEMKERLVNNNTNKNAAIKERLANHTILQEFKNNIQSGLSRKDAHQKLLKTFSPLQVENVYNKYASELKSFLSFYNRNNASTIERFENENVSKDVTAGKNRTNDKELFRKMMSSADVMLTEGKDLELVKASLKKNYGIEKTDRFLQANGRVLSKHYGQIGYIYIDANLYENCDKMKEVISGLRHVGKSLLFNVKACNNCQKCVQNAHGQCKKVNLMISNNPVVMSPRAASKLFKRAESNIPVEYIKRFSSKVSNLGNAKLVSQFTLGLKKLAETDATVKTAAANDELCKTFRSTDILKTDIFKSSSVSKIADGILDKAAKKEEQSETSSEVEANDCLEKMENMRAKYSELDDESLRMLKEKMDKYDIKTKETIVDLFTKKKPVTEKDLKLVDKDKTKTESHAIVEAITDAYTIFMRKNLVK